MVATVPLTVQMVCTRFHEHLGAARVGGGLSWPFLMVGSFVVSCARAGDGDVALSEDDIRAMFDYYANFGRSTAQGTMDTMDSFMFMKFAKECPGLLGGALTRTEVDLIFTKAKPKGERRLEFEHFLDALSAFSEKKYPGIDPADALQSLITKHLVPQYEMVQLEMAKTGETEIPVTGVFKRLYDVRNYTGVYAERFRSGDGRINSHADNRYVPARVPAAPRVCRLCRSDGVVVWAASVDSTGATPTPAPMRLSTTSRPSCAPTCGPQAPPCPSPAARRS